MSVVLVTGASSGLGGATAALLAGSGHRVYAASRRGNVDPASAAMPMTMDVDDDQSVSDGVEAILLKEGRIDVVVNCAGYGVFGSIEDTPVAMAQAQFNTNVFGVMRVCQRVLPLMRARARRIDRQRHLDCRRVVAAVSGHLQRHEVRGRRIERSVARGSAAVRHSRRAGAAGRFPHRVHRRQAHGAVQRRGVCGAQQPRARDRRPRRACRSRPSATGALDRAHRRAAGGRVFVMSSAPLPRSG